MIENYLNDTAILYSKGVLSNYGRPSYTEGKVVNCRWSETKKLVKDQSGNTITANAIVYLDPDEDLDYEDKLEKDGKMFIIVQISIKSLVNEVSHKEALLIYG
ncbi:MAG: hypothetical protein M0R80_18340 [Proteobacteria bacterium]|jgi:hypothetical protein|nr:hypothetical protein [Pseudomonadota bacterium]